MTGTKTRSNVDEPSQVPWNKRPLYKRIHWVHTLLLTLTPLIAVYGFFTTPLLTKTLIWSIVYYFMTGIGITGGYHRLWSHKSYSATLPLQLTYAFVGAGAVQGSIKWWSRGHRAHHRHTDTEKDPYSAEKGLIYSHIGWLIMKPEPGKIGYADTSDLNKDPVVAFQHNFYPYFALSAGFIFPTLVAGLGWGDWRGGYSSQQLLALYSYTTPLFASIVLLTILVSRALMTSILQGITSLLR
ncbi:stearoyl-CoA 9-desaturase [Basidiobolus ranarum]|uniref:Stearoyl-CoA 9-desaturase n=1 Tax=Basidiobolus ranarum TaxID=34480 RepID=A0ABR2VVW1_9FUNG